MLPDRVSNPGPLTYESGALPIALRGPASVVWGCDFLYGPSLFLSVVHNTWNHLRPASTACVLP